MDTLVPLIVAVAMFLALEWFWRRPSRQPLPGMDDELEHRPATEPPPEPPVEDWDPFALPFMRRRLDLLAAELDRLDRDPAIFAKAFRTRVAQLAFDAVLADTTRLAAVTSLAAVTTIEMEITGSGGPLREELEV